jgi:hypothetical protein
MIYKGKSVAETSPAYMDRRRIRDAIHDEKLKEHPKGLGWEGDNNQTLCVLLVFTDLACRTCA